MQQVKRLRYSQLNGDLNDYPVFLTIGKKQIPTDIF